MLDYRYQPELIQARFLDRVNRFVAAVMVDGKPCSAHLPTSGRLKELLVAGADAWLRPTPDNGRRTQYSLELIRSQDGSLVSINSQLPNRLMEIWLKQHRFDAYADYTEIHREPRLGDGRADLRLVSSNSECLIEVKSVTLVVDGEARFPDAPTARGTRHLRELIEAKARGERTAVFFVIQRSDARSMAPNRAADPSFATALRDAYHAGVEIWAFTCQVNEEGVALGQQVPIVLD